MYSNEKGPTRVFQNFKNSVTKLLIKVPPLGYFKNVFVHNLVLFFVVAAD